VGRFVTAKSQKKTQGAGVAVEDSTLSEILVSLETGRAAKFIVKGQ
jgi:hypothetical protein